MFKPSRTVIACTLLTLSACSSDNSNKNEISPELNWQSCSDNKALECATLEVPLDYADKSGEKIDISLIRKPATGTEKIGALLFNPGGPGSPGIGLIETLLEFETIPSSILEAYDIVGFDPRGIGESSPIDCEDLGLDDINDYPITPEDIKKTHKDIVDFATACSASEGSYLEQLGSLNVARDMDEIRNAMNEEKLNFIGYSYGTRLAALYLQQFPDSSGRMVLDASVHPDSSVDLLISESLPALESNLSFMMAQCVNIDDSCETDKLLSQLAQRLNTIAADQSTSAQMEFSILADILSYASADPDFGKSVGQRIYEYTVTPSLELLLSLAEELNAEGDDLQEDEDEGNEPAQIAVFCADDAARPTSDSLIEKLTQFNKISDVAAEYLVSQAAICAGWPEALEPLPPIATNTAPLSLLIGGTTDAQTPIAWSQAMAQAIGGTFIKSEHSGHTTVFNEESECIDELVEKFLLDGLAPITQECLRGE